MRVRITFLEDARLVVRLLSAGGGHAGSQREVTLRPGQSWQGWKHKRLAALGEGEHELLSKQQRRRMADASRV